MSEIPNIPSKERSLLDAPPHYSASEASAWANGYNLGFARGSGDEGEYQREIKRLRAVLDEIATGSRDATYWQGLAQEASSPMCSPPDLPTAAAPVGLSDETGTERRLAEACEILRRGAALVAMAGDQSMALAMNKRAQQLLGDLKPWSEAESAPKAGGEPDAHR